MVMHKNGLRCPPHIYQAATWIVYFVNICSFYVVIPASWSLEVKYLVPSIIIYSLLLFALIGTYAIGTVIDPTDPLYYKDKKNNFKIEEIDPHDPENETLSYCKICETRVSGTSKHCSSCDRCVEGFDHHCKWLNNCIGKRNYKAFIILCILSCIYSILYLLVIILNFVYSELDANKSTRIYSSVITSTNILWMYRILMGIAALQNICTLGGVLNLLAFHIWLWSKGITTYQYIKEKIKRESLIIPIQSQAFNNYQNVCIEII